MFSHHQNVDNVIGIIGSGLSGIATFCQLVDKLIETDCTKQKIVLFEKEKNQFATGVPYTTDAPLIWTLNNPASKFKLMSNGITMDVWMNTHRDKWEALFPNINEEYPPRALVGLFLKDQYSTYKNKAILHGLIIEECLEEAVDLHQKHDKWKVMTNTQKEYLVNTLFLCFGHAPNNQFAHLTNLCHFFSANRPVDDLKRIPNEADVYCIGGQASFVDVALWLFYEKHHAGRLHTITRNPAIITTKGNKDECDTASMSELTNTLKTQYQKKSLTFSEAKTLFWNAYQSAAKTPVDLDQLPSPKSALSYQMQKYQQLAVDDEDIGNIDELRAFIFNFYFSGCYAEFWEKLKDDDKVSFNQQFYSFIFAYLTGITPINAKLLLALYDRHLVIEKNGLASIAYDESKERFILHFSNGDREEAEYLIDSSGLGYDISKQDANFPLISNVVGKGYLVPTTFGGVQLNDHGQAFNVENKLQTNLFCIGPTAAYCHPVPSPYASFMAIDAAQKALSAFNRCSSFMSKHDKPAPLTR